MINILDIISECSSPALSALMLAIKRILNIIQIGGPIVLIFSLSLHIFNLMRDPDNKKLIPKIRNSIVAAAVLFFIPMFVNIIMANISTTNEISACWNERLESNYTTPNYYDIDNNTKQPIYQNPSDYQKGSPKPSSSPSQSDLDTVIPTTPGTISGDVEVHYINPNSRVDAMYIKAGNQSMFIDGGYKGDSKSEIAYLEKIGVTKIDYYLGSHAHQNHVEAGPQIIQKFGIKKVFVGRETCSNCGGTPASQHAIQDFAQKQGVSLSGVSFTVLKPGDVFYLGGLKFTCIGPINVNNNYSRNDTPQNRNSLVIRADYGSNSFLFPGDNCYDGTMNEINKAYPNLLNVDVLKNPHHNQCLAESSYKMINAEYVVFLTKSNYSPSNSCINRVKKFGAQQFFIAANNKNGNIVITSDGTTLSAKDNQ